MSLEIECKYLDPDFDSLKAKLSASNAQYLDCVFEENLIFDQTKCAPSLLADGTLLRLRTNYSAKGQNHILTLKLKVPDSANCKIRDEREVCVADGLAMQAILAGLNYEIVAQYEKMRATWKLDNVIICLDTLPFGYVVELEGLEADILACSAFLDLDKLKKSTLSYHDLHQEWLKNTGQDKELSAKDPSFVFTPERKLELLQSIGIK